MSELDYRIDSFDFSNHDFSKIKIDGWFFNHKKKINGIFFHIGNTKHNLDSYGLDSPDVFQIIGGNSQNCRFSQFIFLPENIFFEDISSSFCIVEYADNTFEIVRFDGPDRQKWAISKCRNFSELRIHMGVRAWDRATLRHHLQEIEKLTGIAKPGVVIGYSDDPRLYRVAHEYGWDYVSAHNKTDLPFETLASFYLRTVLSSDVVILISDIRPSYQNWDSRWIFGVLNFGSIACFPPEQIQKPLRGEGSWNNPFQISDLNKTNLAAFTAPDIELFGLPGLRSRAPITIEENKNPTPSQIVYALNSEIIPVTSKEENQPAFMMPFAECIAPSTKQRECLKSILLDAYPLPSRYDPKNRLTNDQKLFSHFISLGDNCEFGLIQREVGLEPLDLFRFGGIQEIKNLIKAFDENLHALGTLDDTKIYEAVGEWISSSDHYGVTFHTHRYVHDSSREDVRVSEQKKLRYLARKTLEDLEEGTKILVRKSNDVITDDEARALYRAVRRHGNCPILIVTQASGKTDLNTVEDWGDGLLRGYISHFAPYAEAYSGSVEEWRDLCGAALALLAPKMEMN
ncbi:hypothetical protein NKW55_02465 [Gluconobacter kondonii]|uniref:Uncharacterized protein n=1 Tax=Gluconobacter kondonii TaxID=941463 RepID=A0ABQ5WTF8_9PROT|nr:hypothetical protein [Gluconobacter kondonii]MCP1235470.1 hypothetical protein [Gluconobacter kondonii]GBR32005.1 hypothetical protein AA3266_0941 [Gluconobacter kondonii NBRC 3266]GLQ65939.1 hypothetical protein GCM10007870_15230 [Gluconobacter kondonii]